MPYVLTLQHAVDFEIEWRAFEAVTTAISIIIDFSGENTKPSGRKTAKHMA